MYYYVNELSLHGQYTDINEFRTSLRYVMECVNTANRFGRKLLVTRLIGGAPVSGEKVFREVIATQGPDFRTRVARWIDTTGPFLEDGPVGNPDEWLELDDGTIVTETAIGEAATLRFPPLSHETGLVSFTPSRFSHHQLEVYRRTDDGPVDSCELDNFLEQRVFARHLEAMRTNPTSWNELVAALPERFPRLTFAPDLRAYLDGQPFSTNVVERTIFLLGILNELRGCYTEDGQRTEGGHELIQNFFHGAKAVFSDASETEKNDATFRKSMTFRNPAGDELECFWHGKIKTPQYRIHFTWPVAHNEPLYVAYIGPKLTKK